MTTRPKDANAWLQTWKQQGVEDAAQRAEVRRWLDGAKPLALIMAERAGGLSGAARDAAMQEAFAVISQMKPTELALYRTRMAKALDMQKRDFNGAVKAVTTEIKAEGGGGGRNADVVETLGGAFGEWLVEYLYDPESKKAALAYRSPERKVGTADSLLIEGVRLVPKKVNDFIENGAVLFPSDVGELLATRELIALLESFIKRWYLLPNGYLAKIIAYYVLLTWVYDAFEALPYLRATGDYGAGKSELMKRVGHVCYRLIMASGSNTAATFFRTVEIYKGTVFIDEADLSDGGDMANDLVKFLNLGAMKGNPISRLVKVTDMNGNESFEPMTFQTFGPKLIAMREDFRDKAVGSRALTVRLMAREPYELKAAGIPLHIGKQFRMEALELRNLLLRWRLEHWTPEIELSDDLMDLQLSSRMNQIVMPIKALAKITQDEELISEIERFMRSYALELISARSMTYASYIVEAMWAIWDEGQDVAVSIEGEKYLWMSEIRKRANDIVRNMAGEEEEDEGGEEKKKKKKQKIKYISPQLASKIIRDELQLRVGRRQGAGVPVYWDEIKMVALGKKYGVLSLDFGEEKA